MSASFYPAVSGWPVISGEIAALIQARIVCLDTLFVQFLAQELP
ncbi:MAG: hypothetical protein AAGF24_16175 [Cyanobacteria bacterium P01_H01_bin.121]